MQSLEQKKNESFQTFMDGLKSKYTKKQYSKCMYRFLKFVNQNNFDYFLILPKLELEKLIQKYIVYLKNKGIGFNYIHGNLSAICTFLMLNDIEINRRKLNKFLPERIKMKDRCYTHEEIQKMLDNSDLRIRMAILIFTSTGIRIGALPSLKIRHITKLENYQIYQFAIYETTKDEYITFCTPECSKAIDSYLEYRQRSGEDLTRDSPLLREQFDVDDPPFIINKPRHIAVSSLYNIMDKISRKAGLRVKDKINGIRARKEVHLNHGFRKFFNTILIDSEVNYIVKEMLMGHKHNLKLDNNYYRPSQQKLIDEYMKAVDSLTINEENRLRIKVKEQEKEISTHAFQLTQLQERFDTWERKHYQNKNNTRD